MFTQKNHLLKICCESSRNQLKVTEYLQQNSKLLSEVLTMKISVFLDKRRKKVDGKYPVKIRYYFKGKECHITTGIAVFEENFRFDSIVGTRKASLYNTVIGEKLTFIESTLEELALKGLLKTKFKDGKELKQFLENGGIELVRREEQMQFHFQTLTEKYCERLSNASTISTYKLMLAKISKFIDINHLFVPDITVAWLNEFDSFCTKSGMGINGKAVILRCIRSIYNYAIDLEFVGEASYPFRRFKIKHAETKHRDLSIEELRYIANCDCSKIIEEQKETIKKIVVEQKDKNSKKHTSNFAEIEKYRDLFMLSFYLCGLNMIDLLFLKPTDIRNGQLSILRRKTGVPLLIRIEPEAQKIIDRYRGSKYLLSFLDTYTTDNHTNFLKRANKNLKHILPFLSTYWARHSWATIAAELDIPDSTIDIALGHKIQGIASVYIKRNLAKVSEANRKVIDYLNNINTEELIK